MAAVCARKELMGGAPITAAGLALGRLRFGLGLRAAGGVAVTRSCLASVGGACSTVHGLESTVCWSTPT